MRFRAKRHMTHGTRSGCLYSRCLMLQATDFSSKLIAELVHTELNSLNSLFNFPLTFGTCHKSRAGSNCLTESKKSSLAQTRVKAFQLGLFTECIAHSKAREKGLVNTLSLNRAMTGIITCSPYKTSIVMSMTGWPVTSKI